MTTGTQPPNEPKQGLAAALAESLKAIDSDYREELRELRALLEEARREAEKDEPNSVKLKAILADCKDMFRTVAALDPMWLGIQRIARMVGID
jgi:pyridoxine/pyridoxamine 5'-phosphate oxidase